MAKTVKEQQQMNDGTNDDDEVSSILEYTVNLEEQEKPPILPLGEYRATITGIEKKFGKDSGNPYLNVKLSISPDNQPADFVEALGSGAPVTVYSMVMGARDIPQDRYNMKQFCKAAGVPMSNRIDAKEFINAEVKVQIQHQKDLQGQDQARGGKIMPA